MQYLSTLSIKDRFKPATTHKSLNGRVVSPSQIYAITKIYPMSPYLTIAVSEKNPEDGFYSLHPKTPVLLPKELVPSKEKILKFLGATKKKKVLGYRLLWDGEMSLEGLLAPQAIAAMKLLFSAGKREFDVEEIGVLFNELYTKFWGRVIKRDALQIFFFYRRHLVNYGLLEEIVDDAPIHKALAEAHMEEL